MFLTQKQLNDREKDICFRTISSKAIFAVVGDAVKAAKGMSIIRMGDGEARLLKAPDGQPFDAFEQRHSGWNKRMGIDGLSIETIKKNILAAGNTCTYFAPSVSGISRVEYALHDSFHDRDVYFDNFFVNDWAKEMITMLLTASNGVFIIHKDYDTLIENFVKHYDLPASSFAGFAKLDWRDNDAAVQAAVKSGKQLVLFSAGPAGKIIGPEIAKHGRVVLDIGNTLPGWSTGTPR